MNCKILFLRLVSHFLSNSYKYGVDIIIWDLLFHVKIYDQLNFCLNYRWSANGLKNFNSHLVWLQKLMLEKTNPTHVKAFFILSFKCRDMKIFQINIDPFRWLVIKSSLFFKRFQKILLKWLLKAWSPSRHRHYSQAEFSSLHKLKSSPFNNIFRHIANATILSILFVTYSLSRWAFIAPERVFELSLRRKFHGSWFLVINFFEKPFWWMQNHQNKNQK